VVARIRPLLDKELDKDTIVRAESSQDGKPTNLVRIPNPKNEAEEFSFAFNGVYDMATTQEELFTNEGMVFTQLIPVNCRTMSVPFLISPGMYEWRCGPPAGDYT
jgi:hypothetical protein